MKRILLFVFCTAPLLALSYKMDVRLDVDKKIVTGRETIVWKNEQNAPTAFIPFHLYMNAFSGNDAIFFRETGGLHRGFSGKDDLKSFGFCRVRKITLNGIDATTYFRVMSQINDGKKYNVFWPNEISDFIRPDDTIAILDLPDPVMPGQTVTMEIEFETKLPRVFARSGFYKNFFMVGQWYPKVAVFEGEKGWNAHFYHANSEFFSDFADFDVSIDAPFRHVIGATGEKKSENVSKERKVTRFVAHRVGDFVFTAWDKFCIAKDRWKNVELTLLYQPGDDDTIQRQFRALKAGLDACAYLTGVDYPYPCFTLVDPPFRAGGAGGMEYPMLVTSSASPYLPFNFPVMEMVTVHEFIHNYFYGMVASNEFENAWMDEGLTSYVTAFAIEKYIPDTYNKSILPLGAYDMDRIGNSIYKGPEYPAKAAWEFYDAYGISSYNKPAVYLKTLENLIGEPLMVKLFSTYFQRFKFQHPRPEDFFNVIREVAGDESHDFIRKAFTSKARLDFAVLSAKSVDISTRSRTYFDSKKNMISRIPPPKGKKQSWFENTIVAGNRGDFPFPVKIEALLENGQKQYFTWDGRGEWKKIEFTSTSKMAAAFVDPDQIYVCDASWENNAKVLKNKTSGILAKIAAGLTFTAQSLFGFFAFCI